MKIIKLSSENVKRLVAVSIEPDGNVITIGGKNGAGKTSVLDSIAYALGGGGLIPSEPIRRGETSAKIEVNLGDIVVTRKFRRSKGTCTCESQTAGEHPSSCGIHVLGETTSVLEVTSKDGAKYPSPQSMLDKLLGRLSFDPLAFSRATPKEQRETLRTLLGLDTSTLDQERADALARKKRAETKATETAGRLKALPVFMNVPAEEVSMDEISKAMLEAERLRTVAQDAKRTHERIETDIAALSREADERQERIASLEEQLDGLRLTQRKTEQAISTRAVEKVAAFEALTKANAAVPDTEEIRKRIEETEETNRRVRSNAQRKVIEEQLKSLEAERDKEAETAQTALDAKKLLLEQAQYPVPGLGLSDDGVTLNGLPFEQASTAEQLRVSVAMGLAMNPSLRVLLIRNGNDLDRAGLAFVAEMAAQAEAQVWVERVAESKDGVSVFIEDGQQVS